MNIGVKQFFAKLLKLENSSISKSSTNPKERCQAILDYWLDIELFELPECPVASDAEILSVGAEKFNEKLEFLRNKLIENPNYITKDSRLTVMFQCHRAGYVFDSKDALANKDNNYANNPNQDIPRTFVVAHNFIPHWDSNNQTLTWSLSTEAQDLTVNYSTIRTIYRKCPPATAHNQRFSQWLETRIEDINNLFKTTFSDEQDAGKVDGATLAQKIKVINRDLAQKFWGEPNAQEFMQRHCGAIDTSYANDDNPINPDSMDETDKPSMTQDGLTFRWRFSFFPEVPDTQQLGPFFVADLEHCLTQLYAKGVDGLSKPLQRYLLGYGEQTLLPPVTNQGALYHPLTQKIALGRWASDPKYGLSLMQTVAVNVALNDNEPVVAVNGPPGTGKTTLLKDIIATHVVERTLMLAKMTAKNDWFDDKSIHQQIMRHSIVVASSNNKAVENISKELPAKSSIDDGFLNKISHFASVAPNSDWGLFCAVLGNSTNRRTFKDTLNKLQNHLKYLDDIFKLNALVSQLTKNEETDKRVSIIERNVQNWKDNHQIEALVEDLKGCYAFKSEKDFFVPFTDALLQISSGKLEIAKFVEHWQQLDETEWQTAIDALTKIKKQWFGAKKYQSHHQAKMVKAKTDFERCHQALVKALKQTKSGLIVSDETHWELDSDEYLTHASHYSNKPNQLDYETEQQLQQKSPYASTKLNQARSDLFCASLRLNEAILEASAKQFTAAIWQDLHSLIDGNLEANETDPHYQKLWSLLFLFFPVISTSLSSIENQFKQMQQRAGFGVGIIDEAGQAVSYHVVGLLQRCHQMILVGDPIQLEPVVTIPYTIDLSLAQDYLTLSSEYGSQAWGDSYVVSTSSAQSIADLAGRYYAKIGDRQVGIPLFVHRRCLEPMFAIANRIAYDDKMVSATVDNLDNTLSSGWINVTEEKANGKRYYNKTEAIAAIDIIKHLAEHHPNMLSNGVFIITPFTQMKNAVAKEWQNLAKDTSNHQWMKLAFGKSYADQDMKEFAKTHIGTVHTFQGKEAGVVILCLSASAIRGTTGGIKWVNGKPNLLNVAVTRAKKHLFVIGDSKDWSKGVLSSELQSDEMVVYASLSDFYQAKTTPKSQVLANGGIIFNFGANS